MRKLLLRVVLCSLLLAVPSLAIERQPNVDYRARREALAKKTSDGVTVIFAGEEAAGATDGFRQNNNFYYLTGWSEPGAAVLVASAHDAVGAQAGRSYTEILFLPPRDLMEERWTGPKLGPDSPEAPSTTGFDRVESLAKLDEELPRLLMKGKTPPENDKVYVEQTGSESVEPVSAGLMEWLKRSRGMPLRTQTADARPLLASLRTVKDAGELALMKKAAEASMASQRAAMRAMKPGMNEREIAALLNYEQGKRGCERPAYSPIVGSGLNGTVLHYSDDSGPINTGDLVVIDAAGEYSMYADDITRTLPASGKFTARQREIYEIVLGAQNAVLAAAKPGMTLARSGPNSLHLIAYNYINSHGKDLYGNPLGQYFIHGLGHHIGLNVHDPATYDTPLEANMVITDEPGIYIPEEKIGVRLEDDVLITETGAELLSRRLPRTVEEIEKLMAH